MQLDLTITLPGLFDLENMVMLSNELNIELLTKQVFNFSHDNAMARLFMPYDIMSEIIDDTRDKTIKYKNKNLNNFFGQLDEMQKQKRNNELVYDEETYKQGQKQGKAEVQRLDKIRGTDITKILAKNKVSIWHKTKNSSLASSRKVNCNKYEIEVFKKNLTKIGYPKSKEIMKIKAFQMRFRPELINGKIDKECFEISKSIAKI